MLALRDSVKLTHERPMEFRNALLENYNSAHVVKISQLWHSKRAQTAAAAVQKFYGQERDYARLLYCLVFFHTVSNERIRYGPNGGYGHGSLAFNMNHLETATSYFEVVLITRLA